MVLTVDVPAWSDSDSIEDTPLLPRSSKASKPKPTAALKHQPPPRPAPTASAVTTAGGALNKKERRRKHRLLLRNRQRELRQQAKVKASTTGASPSAPPPLANVVQFSANMSTGGRKRRKSSDCGEDDDDGGGVTLNEERDSQRQYEPPQLEDEGELPRTLARARRRPPAVVAVAAATMEASEASLLAYASGGQPMDDKDDLDDADDHDHARGAADLSPHTALVSAMGHRRDHRLSAGAGRDASASASSSRENVKRRTADMKGVSAAERLQGARFRILNEMLYTTSGERAFAAFAANPSLFQVYHDGFKVQVARWPINPLDAIIDYVLERPPTLVIADFGCGEARLEASVPNKVCSFDLVAVNDRVIACDMAHVPLARGAVDVAIFCLALMGTNFLDYLREAHRVLRIGGALKVVEVASRLPDPDAFVAVVELLGFDLCHQVLSF